MTQPNHAGLIRRLQQQKAALAEFGVEAFGTDNLDALLTRAAALAGQGLEVERAKVLELLPSGDKFLVRAGVGWEPDVVGKATIDASLSSPAGYALLTGEPVESEDLMTDPRFSCPDVLRRHGIKSAVNVIIRGKERPVGVLEVDSQHRRSFTQDDVNFLQGFANLLAAAIDRLVLNHRLTVVADQKEVLLHELQHRVKNSLQVVASMIALQRRKSRHDRVLSELDVIGSRIEALRVLYTKLYLVDHHAEINFCEYLRELCHSLLDSHLPEADSVELDIECTPVNVHLDRSAPLGLVTAEFIINSVKHAFPKGGGRLAVRLTLVDQNTARLELADDGPGMSDAGARGGLGMHLIEQLASQADRRDHVAPDGRYAARARVSGVPMRRSDHPRILVVEDEALIAMEVEAHLRALGFDVLGPVGWLSQALRLAREQALDGALLDVNIKGGEVFPVAEILLARGLPVVLATGYGCDNYPAAFRGLTWLHKPFNARQLRSIALRKFAARGEAMGLSESA